MSQITAKEVEQQYHKLVAQARYADALHLATRYFELFPPRAQQVVYFWRIDMAARLGHAPLVLETLREAVEAGHWYTGLAEDSNFRALRDLPEFQHLNALCIQRRAEEIARAQPVMSILKPEQYSQPYPMIFALHGNGSNIETFAPHWQHAVAAGWCVALPQSPQAQGHGAYSWNDWDWAIPALTGQYDQVRQNHAVDTHRVVLAGFSMGAGLALWLALEHTIQVRGVIAVAPFLSDVEALRPVLADPRNRDLRIYLVASQQDEYCYEVALKLSALLPQYGIEHKLDLYTDIGHAFPPSFEPRVPLALDFILNG